MIEEVQKKRKTIISTVKSVHELFKFVARRVHRNSILFVDRNSMYVNMEKEYHPDLNVKDISLLDEEKGKTFRYIVFMEVLENHNDKIIINMIQKAWKLLENKGRLIVIVPNEDVYHHPHQIRTFKRKSLKKTLQQFGKPKVMIGQPFKWLMMYVDKRRSEKPGSKELTEKRLQITEKLCRGRVVEFGCGTGISTAAIRSRRLEVIGVDMNSEKINEARRNYPDISFIQSDVLKLKFKQESFDTLILPEILEHVSTEVGDMMLEAAWKLLKPSGRLIVSVPNENCIPHVNHIRQFNRRTLQSILEKYGEPRLVTEQPYKWLMMYVDKE